MDVSRREMRTHGTESFPFQIYNAAQQGGDFVPCHWHPELEVILAVSGEIGVSVGEHQYTGRAGDLFFVSAGELHEIRGGLGNRFLALVFPLDFLQFRRADFSQCSLLAPLEEGRLCFPPSLPREHPAAAQIYALMQEAATCQTEQPLGYQLIIKANLLRAVAICSRYELLSRQAAPRTGSRLQYRTQTLRAILAYLDAHYTEKLSLSVLAHEFGMTPGYFCTFFRDCFGRTFIQHLNLLRIERASRLLRETDLPVMEIAFSVGFEHFSYFIKRFRDVFGCTPTVYRKSVDLAAEGGA